MAGLVTVVVGVYVLPEGELLSFLDKSLKFETVQVMFFTKCPFPFCIGQPVYTDSTIDPLCPACITYVLHDPECYFPQLSVIV